MDITFLFDGWKKPKKIKGMQFVPRRGEDVEIGGFWRTVEKVSYALTKNGIHKITVELVELN